MFTNNKYVNFLISYFTAFGAAIFIGMFLRTIKPNIFEPNNLWAIAAAIFLNLLSFHVTFKANVPLKEYWIRRLLYTGFVAFNTPIIFILFGCIQPERWLKYFLTSVIILELLLFVVYLVTDWRTTRATLDKINEVLKKNREE